MLEPHGRDAPFIVGIDLGNARGAAHASPSFCLSSGPEVRTVNSRIDLCRGRSVAKKQMISVGTKSKLLGLPKLLSKIAGRHVMRCNFGRWRVLVG